MTRPLRFFEVRSSSAVGGSSGYFPLVPGENLVTGEARFARYFGPLTSIESDCLQLASSVLTADLAAIRGARESYQRTIHLIIPVVNFDAFDAVKTDLEYAISLMCSDNWTFSFVPRQGQPEGIRPWPDRPGVALLFSGGLDSFAAAMESETPLILVSHDSGNPATRTSQKALGEYVLGTRIDCKHLSFFVATRSRKEASFPAQKEPSQRTRSFLFVTLGALVARRAGLGKVVLVAENGQMAINVPLTASRVGGFSTHTAHPEILNAFELIFSRLLRTSVEIRNPYLYKTKAEVVSNLCHKHRPMIQHSNSCWRAARVYEPGTHCGECIPCLVRRIALEYHGVTIAEWHRDLFGESISALPPDDQGKRNLGDLLEFVYLFSTQTESELSFAYPDLVSEFFDQQQASDMYKRFAGEAYAVLGNYPNVSRIA